MREKGGVVLMVLRTPNRLRDWPQPRMGACPFQDLQVHLKEMSGNVCIGVQPKAVASLPSLQTAAGMSLPGTDPHTAWSCPRSESSKLMERDYGISPHSCAIWLSPFLTFHIFLLKLTPLLPGEQQPGTPADEALTLSPPSFFFPS